MIVVSDTSPITALLTIGHVQLLHDLYQSVRIPTAVAHELARSHVELPDFVRVVEVSDTRKVDALSAELDRGEAEAIVLAKELAADLLLIDETLGRAVAQREGVKIIGLMGVLLVAKRKKLLPSVCAVLDQLENKAGFYLSEEVKQHVLSEAGEV